MASPNLLHVSAHIITNTLEVDIVKFFIERTKDTFSLSLYQVLPGLDISGWSDNALGPVLGFNQLHLLPYISDPAGKMKGSFIIYETNLIYQPNSPRLEQMRDKYLWSYSMDRYYSPVGAIELAKGFFNAGYGLFKYTPTDRMADAFVFRPGDTFNLKRINISEASFEDI